MRTLFQMDKAGTLRAAKHRPEIQDGQGGGDSLTFEVLAEGQGKAEDKQKAQGQVSQVVGPSGGTLFHPSYPGEKVKLGKAPRRSRGRAGG
jgi:hypothetical protein